MLEYRIAVRPQQRKQQSTPSNCIPGCLWNTSGQQSNQPVSPVECSWAFSNIQDLYCRPEGLHLNCRPLGVILDLDGELKQCCAFWEPCLSPDWRGPTDIEWSSYHLTITCSNTGSQSPDPACPSLASIFCRKTISQLMKSGENCLGPLNLNQPQSSSNCHVTHHHNSNKMLSLPPWHSVWCSAGP